MIKKKAGGIFFSIGACVLFLIIQVIASIGVSFLYGFIKTISHISEVSQGGTLDESQLRAIVEMTEDPNFLILCLIAANLISVIVFGIGYYLLFGKAIKTERTGRKVFSFQNVSLVILIGVIFEVLLNLVLMLIEPLIPEVMEEFENMTGAMEGGNVGMYLLTVVVLAPLAEEFLFRGLILRKLEKSGFSFAVVMIVPAALFGICHLNVLQGIYAFVGGLILGYIAIKTKSIFPCIIFHVILNLTAVFIGSLLPPALMESTIWMVAVSIVCVCAIIALLILFRRVEMQKSALPQLTDEPIKDIINPCSDDQYGAKYEEVDDGSFRQISESNSEQGSGQNN